MIINPTPESIQDDIKALVDLHGDRFKTRRELWEHIAPIANVSVTTARKYGLKAITGNSTGNEQGKNAPETDYQSEKRTLSNADRDVFLDAILNPAAPNEKLKQAATNYKKMIVSPETSSDYEIKTREPRILLFDIETAPNIGYTWGKYEQNVIAYTQEWYMLAFCAKWLNSGDVISKCLPDYQGYKSNPTDDGAMIRDLWKLFDEADVIVGHNGDQFDIKKSNAKFIIHGLNPPSPYKTIDTKKIAKRYFKFNSNKLDDLGNTLGVGRKMKHTGFDLWQDCMSGDLEAWEVMRMYNRQDVLLLERVYHKLKPYITNHPNMGILSEIEDACPVCASPNVHKRGHSITATGKKRRYQCQDCGAWSVGSHKKVTDIR